MAGFRFQRLIFWPFALWLLIGTLSPLAAAGWRETMPGAYLIGAGDFHLWGFRIYTARLWAQQHGGGNNQPFALELTYHRSISREALIQASMDEMRRLRTGSPEEAQLADWQRQMKAAFVDVEPGRRITGVYLPDRGCRFYVDDRLSHVVDNPAFARAFFDIWLNPRTRNPELREQLLGAQQN